MRRPAGARRCVEASRAAASPSPRRCPRATPPPCRDALGC
eukprot:COSAG01_NODE_2075_length_8488_cov_3.845274_10_plen_39_part_01